MSWSKLAKSTQIEAVAANGGSGIRPIANGTRKGLGSSGIRNRITMSARLRARKARSAANEDSSAKTFRSPTAASIVDSANIRSAAIQGVSRTGISAAKIAGNSRSRAMENASRELVIIEISTVFAVAKIAMTLSVFFAPGHI